MKPGERTRDALVMLDVILGDDPNMQRLIREAEARQDLAQQIYDARNARGLSQEALAKLVGTSQSTIARLEEANTSSPTVRTLRKIADALGMNLVIALEEPAKSARAKRKVG